MGQKINTFTDYLEAELNHIKKANNPDITEMDSPDFYRATLLQSLQGNYDDLADYINIQAALHRLLELNLENIKQLTKP